MEKIRIGIMGYGNLGRGAELAVRQNPDMELAAFFTRRDPKDLKTLSPNVPVYPAAEAEKYAAEVDVLLICGGSATDLPEMTPAFTGAGPSGRETPCVPGRAAPWDGAGTKPGKRACAW